MSGSTSIDIRWLRGFGGVKLAGRAPAWPVRVCDADEDVPAHVRSKKQAGRILVHAFGDHTFVWARPEMLVATFEIDLDLVDSTRANMPMHEHRRYDIYGGPPHQAGDDTNGQRKRRQRDDGLFFG